MAKKDTIDQVNQLIDIGKEKGFLTYEEVNDILPSDVVSPEQIDDLMIMFGEMDIEIVDGTQKVKIPKRKLNKIPEETEGEAEGEVEQVPFEKLNDPVRMYLREMGSVSLLNRDEEVEIAKRIEEGENEIADVVLNAPLILKEIITLGEKLKAERISVREVIKDLDDEEAEIDEEHYSKKILSLVEKIKRGEQKKEELQKKLTQKNVSEAKKKELRKKITQKNEKILDLINKINLNKDQIEKVAHKLRHFLERQGKAEREVIQCTEATGIPLDELKKAIRQVKKGRSEEKKVEKKYGVPKKTLLEYEKTIKECPKEN